MKEKIVSRWRRERSTYVKYDLSTNQTYTSAQAHRRSGNGDGLSEEVVDQ